MLHLLIHFLEVKKVEEIMIITSIILTYKKLEFLYDAINSVLMQEYPKIDLIISDDGSPNFNRENIIKYINQNKSSNIIRTTIITRQKNIGTVRNLNEAINKSIGDIIMPLAADDIFYDKTVMRQVAIKFCDEECNVLSCSRYKYTEDLKKPIRLMPHVGYRKKIEKNLSTASQQYKELALGRALEFASGATLYYRTSFIKAKGLYDTRYILWEDGPFLARITRDGEKVRTAYDIIAIKYRAGGISEKHQKKPSKIHTDYINAIKYEYLNYNEHFDLRHIKIIRGRLAMLENYNRLSLNIVFNYPETILNLLYVKLIKVKCRFEIYMRNTVVKNEI